MYFYIIVCFVHHSLTIHLSATMMDHDASASARRLLREEDCDPRLPFLFHHINLSDVGENGDHSPLRVRVAG